MSDEIVIKVENASKIFRLPHEKNNSIKSAVINFYKSKHTYEKQKALNEISFEVKKGEFFGIIGRNGSGKSTLLKMLAGIYSPSKGTVQVNGKLTPFIELGVGFSPELTGRENVFLNGALFGFSRKEMEKMYPEIVEFAEIERFMDQKLKNYSSGMQVRLAFSIAIRVQSDILLLDEVLAVGDAAFQQKCFDYFEELKKQEKTVVFVTHDMASVRRFCSRAIYLENGNLTQIGTPFEIADTYLEKNMEKNQESIKKRIPGLSDRYAITSKISNQTKSGLTLEIDYKSKNKDVMYAGISIIKEGVSAAEITTSDDHDLIGNGQLHYSLDTSIFNSGVYEITTALVKRNGRKLLSISDKRMQFIIKGDDSTKGGAIKLKDTWEYK